MDLPAEAERIQRYLVELDVPPADAGIYVRLLLAGPSKAKDMAASAGLARDETYRRLRQLSMDGFVWATLTRPMMFVAAQPEGILADMRRRFQRQARSVERARSELIALLDGFWSAAEPRDASFSIVSGRARADEKVHELLDDAMHQFLVVSSHPAAARFAGETGFWQRVAQRAEAGVAVHVLVPPGATAMAHGQRASGPNCHVRLLRHDALFRFAIADGQRMVFFTCVDPSPGFEAANDRALVTEAVGMIACQRALFWRLWQDAILLEPATMKRVERTKGAMWEPGRAVARTAAVDRRRRE